MSYQQPKPNPYSTYGDPYAQQYQQPAQSSGLGITAMCLSIGGGIVVFLMVLYAGYMSMRNAGNPPEEQAVAAGLGLLMGCGLSFTGGVLGLVALLSPNQTKGFAAVGLAIGLMVVLGIVTLVIIGMTFRPPANF